jgi:hypothetical protein
MPGGSSSSGRRSGCINSEIIPDPDSMNESLCARHIGTTGDPTNNINESVHKVQSRFVNRGSSVPPPVEITSHLALVRSSVEDFASCHEVRTKSDHPFSPQREVWIRAQFISDFVHSSALTTSGLRTLRYWCQLFTLGRNDLHDKDRPGRPRIDHVDAEILAYLQKESFSSTHSLAPALNLSQSMVLDRLHNSIGMKNWHVCWIPHELTDDLRGTRVSKCRELLNVLERMAASAFRNIVTGDESRFHLCHHPCTQSSISREDAACAMTPGIDPPKVMLTVI